MASIAESPSSPVVKRLQFLSPITNGFGSLLRSATQGTNDNHGSSDHTSTQTYIQLNSAQFEALLHNRSHSTNETSFTPHSTPSPPNIIRPPSYYNNAKYEDIACKPIKPLYDGSEDQLIPFLTLLDIQQKDEGWSPATFCSVTVSDKTNVDLIHHFAHVPEVAVHTLATTRWSSATLDNDMHIISHGTFNARLLAKLLHASVTDEFHSTLINKVPQSYHCDGTYLLWSIGNHVYRNNVAFIEHVCEQIITTTLADHNNDVPKYLLTIKNKLCMMTSPNIPYPNGQSLSSWLVGLYIALAQTDAKRCLPRIHPYPTYSIPGGQTYRQNSTQPHCCY
jgi:hypothetical protein